MNDVTNYRLKELEEDIARGDNGSVRARWESGRSMLCNRKYCDDKGDFIDGALKKLCKLFGMEETEPNRRELYFRRQIAYQYKTESQFCELLTKFTSWHAICRSELPLIEPLPDEEEYNPNKVRPKKRDSRPNPAQNLLFADYQKDLFPEDDYNDESKLEELEKYTVTMEKVTARFHRRDLDRRAYLEKLLSVVNGNKEATWGQAKIKYEAIAENDPTFVDLEPGFALIFCSHCDCIKHTPNSTCWAGADEV